MICNYQVPLLAFGLLIVIVATVGTRRHTGATTQFSVHLGSTLMTDSFSKRKVLNITKYSVVVDNNLAVQPIVSPSWLITPWWPDIIKLSLLCGDDSDSNNKSSGKNNCKHIPGLRMIAVTLLLRKVQWPDMGVLSYLHSVKTASCKPPTWSKILISLENWNSKGPRPVHIYTTLGCAAQTGRPWFKSSVCAGKCDELDIQNPNPVWIQNINYFWKKNYRWFSVVDLL